MRESRLRTLQSSKNDYTHRNSGRDSSSAKRDVFELHCDNKSS